MDLTQLPKVKERSKKRVGRGLGSGKGKTAARGQKGQKARGKIPAAVVGGGLILYKKLPFRRGLGNSKVSPKPVVVNLSQLNSLKPNTKVNANTLIESGLVNAKEVSRNGIKVLSRGELTIPLTVELPVSESAKAAIEKAGGQVVW